MTPKQRENRRSHPGHTLQWPAFLSIWQVSQFGPVLGHLPFPPISLGEHSPSCHTISMQRIPCPDLPVYVWPLPGHSIPCYAIPYLCLPYTVSGHVLPAILEHTSPRLSIRAGFPSTQEDATPPPDVPGSIKSPGNCHVPHLVTSRRLRQTTFESCPFHLNTKDKYLMISCLNCQPSHVSRFILFRFLITLNTTIKTVAIFTQPYTLRVS